MEMGISSPQAYKPSLFGVDGLVFMDGFWIQKTNHFTFPPFHHSQILSNMLINI